MRRKVSSKENIPVQATSFTGQFASFASDLGGNFLDHPLSGLAGLPFPLIGRGPRRSKIVSRM